MSLNPIGTPAHVHFFYLGECTTQQSGVTGGTGREAQGEQHTDQVHK